MMHAQTYNFVAKRIREDFPTNPENDTIVLVKRGTLVELALRCAYGFMQDNPEFNVMRFLEQCSPDNDRYPITELWGTYVEERKNECEHSHS